MAPLIKKYKKYNAVMEKMEEQWYNKQINESILPILAFR